MYLKQGGFILEADRLRQSVRGATYASPSLPLLPGTKCIVAGLVAKPDIYYRVPAMRMVVDFVVYVGMLAVFTMFALFHNDGALTPGEVFFAFYILVSGIYVAQQRESHSAYVRRHTARCVTTM